MNNLKLNFFNGLAVTAIAAALLTLPLITAQALSSSATPQNTLTIVQIPDTNAHS